MNQIDLPSNAIAECEARIESLRDSSGRHMRLAHEIFGRRPDLARAEQERLNRATGRIPEHLHNIETLLSTLPEVEQLMFRAPLFTELKDTLFCYEMVLGDRLLR